ncbi:MAG: DUF1653 domain-containing protein [Lachnospiraceae bacterium]|nr:DUF1653 domain-containing protein [Lachnospiraceae bacterium]
MSFTPRPHEIYKHFKGNLYQITAIAQHTETDELLVVYQALYGEFKTYARPLDMFLSEVDRQKYPDAGQKYRFELQGDNEERQIEREQSVVAHPTAGAAKGQSAEKQSGEEQPDLDPQVLAFLDANTYEDRLNILAGLHHRITDDMITTMAVACDVEVSEGELEERYTSLRSCLLTLEKYECNRLR